MKRKCNRRGSIAVHECMATQNALHSWMTCNHQRMDSHLIMHTRHTGHAIYIHGMYHKRNACFWWSSIIWWWVTTMVPCMHHGWFLKKSIKLFTFQLRRLCMSHVCLRDRVYKWLELIIPHSLNKLECMVAAMQWLSDTLTWDSQ